MAPGTTLGSVAGSHTVPDTSGDTSTPFDRGVRGAGHAHLLNSESPFLDSGRGQGASGQGQVHWADFPQRLKRSEPIEHPQPRSLLPRVDPSPVWQIADNVTDEDPTSRPAECRSCGISPATKVGCQKAIRRSPKPSAHPIVIRRGKQALRCHYGRLGGQIMRVTGAGLGKVCTGDTLMNVARWSASTGWKPTFRTRWSRTGAAAGRHPGKG